MPIEIYHLAPGTYKKRTELIEDALSSLSPGDYASLCHLAPTRHLLADFGRMLQARSGGVYIAPTSATLKQFATGVYERHGDHTPMPEAMIPLVIAASTGLSSGMSIKCAELYNELRHQYPLDSWDDIKAKVMEAFKDANTPESVSQRSMRLISRLDTIDHKLRQNGAIDSTGLLRSAADLIKTHYNFKLLILDGFYELTPLEALVVSALINRSERVLALVPYAGQGDSMDNCYTGALEGLPAARDVQGSPYHQALHFAAPSKEAEMEFIARSIKRGWLDGSLKNLEGVYVAFPDLDPYRSLVTRVFRRHGLPCSLLPGKPLSRTRPMADMLCLLRSVAAEFPRLDFARALSSPFFKKVPKALRESIARISASGVLVRGQRSWMKEFVNADLAAEGRHVFTALKPLLSLEDKAPISVITQAALESLEALMFSPSEGAPLSATREVLIPINRLEGFCSGPVTLKEYTESLELMIASMSDKDEGAGVKICSLFEVRGLEPSTLFIGGLRDGDIPSRPDFDFILPDGIRRRLGLMDMRRYLSLQEMIYSRIVRSSRSLHLSYTAMEGDKLFLPSVFLSGTSPAPLDVDGIYTAEDLQLSRSLGTLGSRMSEITGMEVFNDNTPLRVTDIDAFRGCPRKYFIERALRLEPDEVAEYEMEPRALGSAVHNVMEALMKKPFSGYDSFRLNAIEALDEVLPGTEFDSYFKSLIRETFLSSLPQVFDLESGFLEEGYSFNMAELPIEDSPIEGIKLKGKIDRIDRSKDGVQVIDYKTGTIDFSAPGTLERGENLQLFLYAAMLRRMGMNPLRAGIYSLKDMKVKWLPGKRGKKDGPGIDDFIDVSLRYLDETVREMRKGDFPARPSSEQRCASCNEKPHCPYIHGSNEDGKATSGAIS